MIVDGCWVDGDDVFVGLAGAVTCLNLVVGVVVSLKLVLELFWLGPRYS